MNQRNKLKVIHLVSTIWLVVCMVSLFVLALRQAGFNWWVIFSLSGHSLLVILLLVSLYLFAIFGSTGKGQRTAVEHPLTSTGIYMLFYVSAPLLGMLGGALAVVELPEIGQLLPMVALGTFAATFLTWVIIDPLATTLETFAPASREHRLQRLAADKRQREEQRRQREALLGELLAQQEQDRCRWREILAPETEKLAELLKAGAANFEQAERDAVDIGVRAWQIGGLDCMHQLRDTVLESYKERYRNTNIIDHISNWWDGIGSWRTPATG
jgi:hypothetical protein